MKEQMTIENHSGIDKSFLIVIADRMAARVDYDDVNHTETDAAVKYLQELMRLNWNDLHFKKFYKDELIKEYASDKYLQEEYPTLQDYLSEMLH